MKKAVTIVPMPATAPVRTPSTVQITSVEMRVILESHFFYRERTSAIAA